MLTAEACEKALIKALKAGKSCVVDRCNVTPSDRRLWMQHARRACEKGIIKGVELHFEAVWMSTPVQECKRRAQSRQAHETLSPENADAVIDSFCRGLRPPEKSGQEPYDDVHVVVSLADADLLVQRFRDPTKVDASARLAPPAEALAVAAAGLPVRERRAEGAAEGWPTVVVDAGSAEAAAAELFILRHGERADRAKGRDGGHADDAPLTKEGREMAKTAGAALRALGALPWAPAVYSSPYYRCLQTANEVAAELGHLPVRIEPGLAELAGARLFAAAPALREPAEALQGALTRTEVDLSVAPHRPAMPQWPEMGSDAKLRVLAAARAIAARHPGRAVCIVCHSHSLVELTRHLPTTGSGAAASTAGYCALSHISSTGVLLQSLNQSYLRAGEGRQDIEHGPSVPVPSGRWCAGWRWQDAAADKLDPIDGLLALGIDAVMARSSAFAQLFAKGSLDQQEAWRVGWACGDDEIRRRLQAALERGIFVPGAVDAGLELAQAGTCES